MAGVFFAACVVAAFLTGAFVAVAATFLAGAFFAAAFVAGAFFAGAFFAAAFVSGAFFAAAFFAGAFFAAAFFAGAFFAGAFFADAFLAADVEDCFEADEAVAPVDDLRVARAVTRLAAAAVLPAIFLAVVLRAMTAPLRPNEQRRVASATRVPRGYAPRQVQTTERAGTRWSLPRSILAPAGRLQDSFENTRSEKGTFDPPCRPARTGMRRGAPIWQTWVTARH